MFTHAHDHDHEPHHHGHDHHDHHHAHAEPGDWRYGVSIALNLAIVLIEAVAGFFANSTALVADAGHNLSDVLGLALAGAAVLLARRPARGRRTYGFGKAPVLAAMANGVVLMLVSGGILIEAVHRLLRPEPVHVGIVMVVALVGVVANTATALMFVGKSADINRRGVFLHMAGDALVSVGVIAAAGLIWLTGWSWIDPAVSVVIVAVIVAGTWSLLREATDMVMDAAPTSADVPAIEAFLIGSDGVVEVHDLHIWAMSNTEVALTAHLVRPDNSGEEHFRRDLAAALSDRFNIRHATLQIEPSRADHCPEC